MRASFRDDFFALSVRGLPRSCGHNYLQHDRMMRNIVRGVLDNSRVVGESPWPSRTTERIMSLAKTRRSPRETGESDLDFFACLASWREQVLVPAAEPVLSEAERAGLTRSAIISRLCSQPALRFSKGWRRPWNIICRFAAIAGSSGRIRIWGTSACPHSRRGARSGTARFPWRSRRRCDSRP
jgi:hypothetical protein